MLAKYRYLGSSPHLAGSRDGSLMVWDARCALSRQGPPHSIAPVSTITVTIHACAPPCELRVRRVTVHSGPPRVVFRA